MTGRGFGACPSTCGITQLHCLNVRRSHAYSRGLTEEEVAGAAMVGGAMDER